MPVGETGYSLTKKTIASTYNGTATVTLKKGPVTGVPISIKLMGPTAMSLWIDPGKTTLETHQLYGVQHRVK
ncbi:MAG: hypothetical protein WBE34_00730 [Candidatus Nitrosopolaris sp.]